MLSHNQPPLAAAKRLDLVQAKTTDCAQAASLDAVDHGAVGLAGVLDNGDPGCYADEFLNIARQPVKVYRDYRSCTVRDFASHIQGVDVESSRMNVDEHGHGPAMDYGRRGPTESEGWNDDFVTGLDAYGPQRQVKGVGARTYAEAVGNVHVVGPLLRQQFSLIAPNEPAALHNAEHGVIVGASQDWPRDELVHMELIRPCFREQRPGVGADENQKCARSRRAFLYNTMRSA